ncbi:hypothetical protein [Pseudoroseomonas ludipueritiae]|uniref:Uncharacterized protein n=1 Tax=Pseudoroseomonas ludipueritiae TaxID=198093 RepID=A0ABR7RD19_9PROT|nr:hypothetical protein [Pseudoroseomonas ludipueritiae]MBC9179573.1 hypothetical protein [Pseudoroseomonas ludipueritiae]
MSDPLRVHTASATITVTITAPPGTSPAVLEEMVALAQDRWLYEAGKVVSRTK